MAVMVGSRTKILHFFCCAFELLPLPSSFPDPDGGQEWWPSWHPFHLGEISCTPSPPLTSNFSMKKNASKLRLQSFNNGFTSSIRLEVVAWCGGEVNPSFVAPFLKTSFELFPTIAVNLGDVVSIGSETKNHIHSPLVTSGEFFETNGHRSSKTLVLILFFFSSSA